MTHHDIIKFIKSHNQDGRHYQYLNRRTREVLSEYTAKNIEHELEVDHLYYREALIKAGLKT